MLKEQPAAAEEEVDDGAKAFNPDNIPPKVLITSNKFGDSETVALFHSDASYQFRKIIMEAAMKNFPELERAEINQLLNISNQR